MSATARQLILFISARLLLLSRVPVEKRPDETLRMDICPTLIENRHPSKPRPPGAENAGAIVGETHRSYKTVLRICLLSSGSKGYRLDKARATSPATAPSVSNKSHLRLILRLAWHCCADPSNAQKAYGQKEMTVLTAVDLQE